MESKIYHLDHLENAFLERVSLGSKIFDEIDEKIRESYENCCILYIDEIKNNSLVEKYENLKRELIEKRGENIIKDNYFFHGTKKSSILGIAENGFKVSLNRVNAYGIGTYLSPLALTTSSYTDINREDSTFLEGVEVSYIFYCKVLTGKTTVGKNGKKLNTNLYDTAVNNIKKPTIYSIPYDDAIIPLYVIAFYKNASI